ncbi:hypothetical protein ACFQ4C_15210 [Larkinella insperata]|uniref:Uncharacterized protein n=1 Tax=Larkinella insperata TaxID=332158 RepID=A0ABW3QDF0_9BACT|nr:hypothetical protein [Larkinella insperata]
MKTNYPHQYSFTNRFEYTGLKNRIQMMNLEPSDAGWWRYALLWLLTIVLVMACQNWQDREETKTVYQRDFPLNNPTRVLVDQIETGTAWGRLLSFYRKSGKSKTAFALEYGDPLILRLKGETLSLVESYRDQTTIYLNGKEASIDLLAKLRMDYVEELFVLHEFEGMDYSDPKPYRLLIQISDNPIGAESGRSQFAALLEAAAITDHPQGTSHTYTMNTLLEATFFGYPDAFVKRTKNQHLKLMDEFSKDIDVFINGIPVDPKDVETVHVREVDRLYTHERPYTLWLRNVQRQRRYVLYIQTAPKRARRDSSYYVFSPFYSGDF